MDCTRESYRQSQCTWRVCCFHQDIRFPRSLASLVWQWWPRGAAGTACAGFLVLHAPRGPFLALPSSHHSKGIMKMDPTVGWEVVGGRPTLNSGHGQLDRFCLDFLVSGQQQRWPSSPSEMGSLGQRAPRASSGSCALSPTLPPRATVWAQLCFQSP